MNIKQAQSVAQDVLIWFSQRPEELGHLMAATGMDVNDVTTGATDATFLGFFLDFLLTSEETLIAVADDLGVDPHTFARARAALPGGQTPDWT